MKRPIVLGVEGHAADIVRDAGAGICIEPENECELVEAVTQLAQDLERARELGLAGYEKIAPVYDYDRLAANYAVIAGCVAQQRSER